MKKQLSVDDFRWLIKELAKIRNARPYVLQIGRWCEEQLKLKSHTRNSARNTGASPSGGLRPQFDMIPKLQLMEKVKHMGQMCLRCCDIHEDPWDSPVRGFLCPFQSVSKDF